MAHGSLGYYVIFCVYDIECRVWVCYCVDELWGGARVLSLVHSWLFPRWHAFWPDPRPVAVLYRSTGKLNVAQTDTASTGIRRPQLR